MFKQKEKPTYKKNGRIPTQSRVFIDYTKKKPKITFQYLFKEEIDNYSGMFNKYIYFFVIILCIGSFLYFSNIGSDIGIPAPKFMNYPDGNIINCSTTFDTFTYQYPTTLASFLKEYNYTSINYMNLTCITSKNQTFMDRYWYDSSTYNFQKSSLFFKDPTQLLKYPLISITIPIIGLLLLGICWKLQRKYGKYLYKVNPSFIKERLRKRHEKHIERIAKMSTTPRYRWIFKSCPSNNIIEIPIFKNMYIGYEATEDFGKYLQRIEIKEIGFMERVKKKLKNNKKFRKGINWRTSDRFFYAKFFFSKNPKKGQLKLEWK